MTLAQRIHAVDTKRGTKQEPPPVITPRLVEKSPFAISEHAAESRKGFIQEHRRDADILDQKADALRAESEKQIADLTAQAFYLRFAADHMEKNPPEPIP